MDSLHFWILSTDLASGICHQKFNKIKNAHNLLNSLYGRNTSWNGDLSVFLHLYAHI
jgi:hypothetical protein